MKNKWYAWVLYPSICFLLFAILRIPASQNPLPQPIYSTSTFNSIGNHSKSLDFTLKDVTLEAGIKQPHTQRSEELSGIHESLGAGACAFDYNNDGWLDLLTLNGSGTTHFYGKPQWWQQDKNSLTLYQNNQDGTFQDITLSSQLLSSSWTMGCATADLDNDGDDDIFVSNYGENQLWRNNGDGSFTDITNHAGIGGNGWSTSVSVADINNDGLLDIYVNNYIDFQTNSLTFEKDSGFESALSENFNPTLYSGQANQLLINRGDLKFVDYAEQYGIDNAQGRSLSSQWFDIDNNGFPDLIVANDRGSANKVYLNENGTKFTDVSTESRLAFVDKASNINITDFNNDGSMEIFITTDNTMFPRLYTLMASPVEADKFHFKDVSDKYKLHNSTKISQSHWGSIASDFNLDGWVDLFIANGIHTPDQNARLIPRGQINTLLINNQGEYFTHEGKNIDVNTYPSLSSRCALPLDFNNDGAPDIYLTHNNGLGQLLENTSTNHQWLGVQVLSNGRTSYGAKAVLEITDHGTIINMERYAGQASFLCSGDQRIVFGLGGSPTEKQLRLSVTWPDGKKVDFSSLEKNYYYIVHKEKSYIEKLTYTAYDRQSRTVPNDPQLKLTVVKWLMKQNKIEMANSELRLLIQHADESVRRQALALSQQLPTTFRNAFTQIAMTEQSSSMRIAAIQIVKDSEDELFSRWLLKQLEHDDADVACVAAESFAHFFDEEEAMLLTKYTALNSLIRLVQQPDTKKQLCAVKALGRSEKYRALQPLITLLDSTENEIRLASIKALGLLKDKAAIRHLESVFLSTGELLENRTQALIAIKQISSEFDIPSLLVKGLESQQKVGDENSYSSVIRYAFNEAENSFLIRKDILIYIDRTDWKALTSKDIFTSQKVVKKNYFSPYPCQYNTKNQVPISEHDVAEYLAQCLSEKGFYKNMPQYIKHALEQNYDVIRIEIFKRISSRKERWARDLTMTALNDMNTPLSIQKVILQNLPTDLSSAVLKRLSKRFTSLPDSEVAPYIAKRLFKSDRTEIVDMVLDQIKLSLQNSNAEKALLYAEAMVDHNPDKVFALLIRE